MFLILIHNFLRNDEIGSLKIVDFGLSTLMKDGPLNMRCGSPGYVAPEVLNDLGYGTKADIFSAGIILYILY
jgi:serine/threonine protein kinase